MTQASAQTGNDALALPRRRSAVGLVDVTLLSDLSALTKPRIAMMVALTVWLGYALVVPVDGQGGWLTPLGTMLGTALAAMGSATLNQVIERRTDARMRRTQNRPLPTGRMSPVHVTILGLALALMGSSVVWAVSNIVAAGLTGLTVAAYCGLYTPLKRVTSLNTIVGALPGALPPVIGCAAVAPEAVLQPPAIMVFSIMFLWQLPHFLAIAWLYREDYARAGLMMLPVVEPRGEATFRQITLTCLTLVPLGLLPSVLGFTGGLYFIGALTAGVVFLGFGLKLARSGSTVDARVLFLASLVYLPLVLTLMVVDRI